MDPLTVAYVGNFRHPWCTEVHVAGSLGQLGHTVLQLQEDQLDWARLPELATGAQLVLWTRTWPADMDVVLPQLDRLRTMGVPSVSYHLDRWWGLDREHQVNDQPFFHTDLVVSPDGGNDHRWAEAGVNHLWLPPGVYGPECGTVPPNPHRYPHDVVFVGSHPYPHPEWRPYRDELIDTMRAHFGGRFGVWPQKPRGEGHGRPVRGRALQQLYATAKVVVGDSCLAGGATHYWSDRIPETLGRGGLLIHPKVEGLADWYTSADRGQGDFLGYQLGDFAQAVELAEVALATPAWAREVADTGRATVLGRDTYAHRLDTVLHHVADTIGLGPHQVATTHAVATPAAPRARGRANGAPRPLRATQGRWRALFDPRPDQPEDARVIAEVWDGNDYRMPTAGYRGTVLDVGANIGAFTVLAAMAGASKVVAVEPELANLERLQHHVRTNGLDPVVTVVPLAVVPDDVAAPLVGMVGAAGGAHVGQDGCEGHRVGTTTLAKLLLAYGPVELLKIDCEGAEFAMIEATDPELLRTHVERIALEWHGPAMPHLQHLRGDEFGALVTRLADCGTVETKGHPARGGLLHWRRY